MNHFFRIIVFVFFLLLSFAALMVVFPEETLPWVGRYLVVNQQPEKADGIVVLLGARGPDRVVKSFELYQAGLSSKLIFGSGYIDQTTKESLPKNMLWPRESDQYLVALHSLNVPKESIILVNTGEAFDTSSELEKIAAYAKDNGLKKLLLVSSANHTRRVSLIWKRVNTGVEGIIIAAQPNELDRWWTSGPETQMVGRELCSLVKEFWRQANSWIKP